MVSLMLVRRLAWDVLLGILNHAMLLMDRDLRHVTVPALIQLAELPAVTPTTLLILLLRDAELYCVPLDKWNFVLWLEEMEKEDALMEPLRVAVLNLVMQDSYCNQTHAFRWEVNHQTHFLLPKAAKDS